MDLQELKERSKQIWGTGDYAPTGRQLEPVSAALVEALGIGPGHRVLDVAAGHGNCALAAARKGAEVVASDFSAVMIEHGRARTDDAGVEMTWTEADAADLPFDDAAFDRVTSVFGAIFAPEQQDVAAELVRVTAPGGTVGLTAWTPDGFIAQLVRIPQEHGPPRPEEGPDAMAWGDPAHVEDLFAGLECELELTPRAVTFSYPSMEAWQRDLEAHGMAVVMKQNMPEDAYAELMAKMRALVAAHDHADGDAVAYHAEYLEILAHVPA